MEKEYFDIHGTKEEGKFCFLDNDTKKKYPLTFIGNKQHHYGKLWNEIPSDSYIKIKYVLDKVEPVFAETYKYVIEQNFGLQVVEISIREMIKS